MFKCPRCMGSGSTLAPGKPDTQPHPPEDPLGRVYTPGRLALLICAYLEKSAKTPYPTILEPGVGDGVFIAPLRGSFPHSKLLAVDVDPGARGLQLLDNSWDPQQRCSKAADFIDLARHWDRTPWGAHHGRPDLIVGNPPFGKAVGIEVTIAFVISALQLATQRVTFILPLPYVCSSEFDVVFQKRRPSAVLRLRARPWPERLREAVVFDWDLAATWDHTLLLDLDGWP